MMKFIRRFNIFRLFKGKKVSENRKILEQDTVEVMRVETLARAPQIEHSNALEKGINSNLVTSNTALDKAEASFDLVSKQVNKLAIVAQGLSKNSRRLGMFSAVSGLWLWFYFFRGIITNWSWMTNVSLVILVLFLIPSALVFCLYFIVRQGIDLPNSLREMKQDILNSDEGALSLFVQKGNRSTVLASWKVFGVIRNFRELLQSFPVLVTRYKSVLALSNPLLATLLGSSVAVCFLVNVLALLTFVLWLSKRL